MKNLTMYTPHQTICAYLTNETYFGRAKKIRRAFILCIFLCTQRNRRDLNSRTTEYLLQTADKSLKTDAGRFRYLIKISQKKPSISPASGLDYAEPRCTGLSSHVERCL